eukprot:15464181-Alexandrium_andersonii.AAC.1
MQPRTAERNACTGASAPGARSLALRGDSARVGGQNGLRACLSLTLEEAGQEQPPSARRRASGDRVADIWPS